jgi:hypothetical protein
MSEATLSPAGGMIALGVICATLVVLAGAGIYQISRAPPEAIGQALVIGATGSAASSVIRAANDNEPPPPSEGGRRRRHKTPRKRRSRRRRV